jgi:hypothetical protein
MSNRQTNRQIVSPFQGEPLTTLTKDKHGNPAMLVNIIENTPKSASWANGLTGLCVFIVLVLLFFVGTGSGNVVLWIICVIVSFSLPSKIEKFFYSEMAKRTDVMFTPTEFWVKADGGSWLVYDRTLTHRFMMMKHDKARDERELHDRQKLRAQKRGDIIAPKRYFDESFHIIFDYMGQRVDVVTVYDQKRATAVAARLKACDKVMDTKNQMGEGEVLNPGEQWGQAPGNLPGI